MWTNNSCAIRCCNTRLSHRDLHFCQQTSPKHHLASTQRPACCHNIFLQGSLRNNQTIWITHQCMVFSRFIHCLSEIKEGFLCLSRQQLLILHQVGLMFVQVPSSHKPTFKGLRKTLPLSIRNSAIAAKRFLSSSSVVASQSMWECGD